MQKYFYILLLIATSICFKDYVRAQYCEPVREMDIPGVTNGIIIDGIGDEIDYSLVQSMQIAKRAGAANPYGLEDGDDIDFNAIFKAAWDKDYLYVFVEVTDDVEESMPVGGANAWTWDCVEVFIDLDTNSIIASYNSQSTIELRFNRGDVGIETPGRAAIFDYLFYQDNYATGWKIETGIPWTAASEIGQIPDMLSKINGIIGFDVSVSDADGDGTGLEGGRNIEGGAQMFWDQDTPIENADNAWQDRRTFGFARLTGGINPDYNDTVLCDSTETALVVFDYPVDSVSTYYWQTSGGNILDSSEISCNIIWNDTGEKDVMLIITRKSGFIDTLKRKIIIYPKMKVSLGEDIRVCKNTDFELNPVITNCSVPLSYFWNSQPGSSSYTGNVTQSGNISLIVRSEAGCIAGDVVYVNIPDPPEVAKICMVTVRTDSNKNQIIWEKSGEEDIMEYVILKETTVSGAYAQLDVVAASEINSYTDQLSQPSKYADRYVITAVDTCGNHSFYSEPHQPIHLQLSQGTSGTYNLSWSPYEGFNYGSYHIYKGSSINSMEKIDEIASTKTQYTDTSSTTCYYQLAVEHQCAVSGQETYTEARSNAVSTFQSVVSENHYDSDITIYPNPFEKEIIIEFETDKQQSVCIDLFNLMGIKVYDYSNQGVQPGIFRHILPAGALNDFGIYLLKVKIGHQLHIKKILRN
ncbi:MAG: T9SS type A sorting domain-containing protein [Bacteroidales bacterium]|nr:T9SS type A sorting domain-containing protein [Bacteroidales bacterium]MBN2764120.1 T9SS type A sorting domain-containing protein [Bacteroidales bacterium]